MKDEERRQLCIANISAVLDPKNPDSYLRYVKKETSGISTPTLEYISNVFTEGQTHDLEKLIRRCCSNWDIRLGRYGLQYNNPGTVSLNAIKNLI